MPNPEVGYRSELLDVFFEIFLRLAFVPFVNKKLPGDAGEPIKPTQMPADGKVRDGTAIQILPEKIRQVLFERL